MKQFKLLAIVLLIAILATACVTKIPEESTPVKDASGTVSEASSDVSVDENSVTDESDSVVLSELSAAELYEYAELLTDEYVNYTIDTDMDMLSTVQGEQSSYSSNFTVKVKDSGTDEEKVSIAITDTSDGTNLMMYYHKNVGYYSDGVSRLSFSCDAEQFQEIAVFIRSGREDSDLNDEYLVENAEVSVAENGDLIIGYKDIITDTVLIKEIFGFADDETVTINNMDIEWTFTMDSKGHPKSDLAVVKFDMVPNIEGIGDFNASSIMTVSCTYNISDNINIVIPDVEYTDIGDYKSLYVTDCVEVLEKTDYYTAKTTIDYDCTANGVSDKLKMNLDFYYDNTDSLKFAMKEQYIVDAQKILYSTYFANGVYSLNDGTGVKEQEIDEMYFNSATLVDSCMPIDFDWTYGENFTYTDNGDGTATLAFNFRKNIVTEFADAFALTMYGQEYVEFFSGASSVTVKNASAELVVNVETGMMIEYNFNVDAAFVIDNMTVNFKENTATAISTETYTFPLKGAFLGSSAM